jgi:nitroreductase/NAD-dependent dihydropyrimidine dehydrogenase PreA subunit
MNSITINESLCTKDGLCSIICPLQIIEPPKGAVPPQPKPEFSKWCISCGHCVAICPTGAISHSTMSPDQCPPADYKCIPGPDQFENILRLRRSVRRFKKQPLEKEVLERLIKMAGYAPSGHNLQPVKWLIFNNRDDLNHLVGLACDWMKHMMTQMPDASHSLIFKEIVTAWDLRKDLVLHDAPCLVMVHSKIQTGTEPTDAAISLAYFDLAALSFGLGCCWAGLFMMAAKSWKPLQEYLELPKGHQLHGAMMAGYPKLKFQRLPVRKQPQIIWR